jgi:hypothetical protein
MLLLITVPLLVTVLLFLITVRLLSLSEPSLRPT